MIIRIKNLRLRTIVGVFDWERQTPQDVVINIQLECDGRPAAQSDDLADAVDYKAIKRRVIEVVEASRCQLLERLASQVLDAVMSDPKVANATVEIDKPGALRFCDSVSVSCNARRNEDHGRS